MGLLWWRKKKSKDDDSKDASSSSSSSSSTKAGETAPGMNGAVEVQRFPKEEVTVFEFGSVATSADKVTLAGYCPVSEQLEPCRWEILPADDSNAPQFRVVF